MISSRRWCLLAVLCLSHNVNSVPVTSVPVTSTESSLLITSGSPSQSSSSPHTDSGVTPDAKSTTASTEEWTSTTNSDVRYEPKITSMHLESNVTLRYAKTLVTSKVANPDTKSNEVTFSVVIPETAFITAFSMEIDGKVYEAYVKEKEEAKKEYQSAVSSGIAAAHVAVKARDSNHFTVSVNVEPQKKAIFRLYYEELLSRRLGLYNLVMNLSPGQLVEDFSVDVDVQETTPITSLHVPSLRTGNEVDAYPTDEPNAYATHTISDDKLNAKVHFAPNKAQQLELMKVFKEKEKLNPPAISHYNPYEPAPRPPADDEGIKGQFVVQYDVDRNAQSEVMINDGYFVHFFAPKDLQPLNKHVVFVLDVSGSMAGRKINQLKEAMTSIVEDLNQGDYFSIIDFHYSAKVYNLENSSKNVVFRSNHNNYYPWDDYDNEDASSKTETLPMPYSATKENIEKAKNIIKGLNARGGTNIYDALTTALKVANTGIQASQTAPESGAEDRLPEPMVIFLTDGDPTVGETNTDKILSTVKEMNPKKVAIFSLAFGEDADRGFLRRVALQNYGFLRHIYEAADAALQLKHFYKLVASPLLSNVTFTYPKDQIDESTLTKKMFEHYFSGSELVIAGKINGDLDKDIQLKLHAKSFTGPIDFIPIIPQEKTRKDFWPLERLWAYITIKQLLDEKDEKGGKAEDLKDPNSPAKKALDLALKYSFVTPLTSLVVVKPNSTSAVDAESVDASGALDRGYALPLIAGGSAASFQQYSFMSAPIQPGYGSFHQSISNGSYSMSIQRHSVLPQSRLSSGSFASGVGFAAYGPAPLTTPFPRRPVFDSASYHTPALPGKPQPLWLSAAAAVALGGLASNNHLPHQQKLGKAARNYNFDARPLVYPLAPVSLLGGPSFAQESLTGQRFSSDDDISEVAGASGSVLSDPLPTFVAAEHQIESDANRKHTTMLPARRNTAGLPGIASLSKHPPAPAYPAFSTTNLPMPTAGVAQMETIHAADVFEEDINTAHVDSDTRGDVVDIPTSDKNVPTANETKETQDDRLKLYGLEAYPWVKEYLDAKEDSVSLPLADKSTIKYKLRKQSEPFESVKEEACKNPIGGGDGVCQYLTKCKDLNKGFGDLSTYLNHSCSADGFAGICCKTHEDP